MDEPQQPKPPRLIVELNELTAGLLNELVEVEELNKSTLVNRAVQLYSMIGGVQRAGGKVYVQEAGAKKLNLLTLQ